MKPEDMSDAVEFLELHMVDFSVASDYVNLSFTQAEYKALCDRLTRPSVSAETARELARFAWHRRSCQVRQERDAAHCDCGYDAALARYNAEVSDGG